MQTLLNSLAFVLCLSSVFRGSTAACATAGREDEACEKMLLVTRKRLAPGNAFLEESEEGVEETEKATDPKLKKAHKAHSTSSLAKFAKHAQQDKAATAAKHRKHMMPVPGDQIMKHGVTEVAKSEGKA
mmetsp:Transcript_48448/g.96375  ORF Transcript_48448/g.96375 Transcript_48448/m.96375 type:complete len:129 (+) Transcript_48448:79-465(+)